MKNDRSKSTRPAKRGAPAKRTPLAKWDKPPAKRAAFAKPDGPPSRRPSSAKDTRPDDQRPAFIKRDNTYSKRPAFTKGDAPPSKRPSYSDRPSNAKRDDSLSERPAFIKREAPYSKRPTFTKGDAPPSKRPPYSDRPSNAKRDAPPSERPASIKRDAPYSKRPTFTKGDATPSKRPPYSDRPSNAKRDAPPSERPAFIKRDAPYNKRPAFSKGDAPPSKRPSYSDRPSNAKRDAPPSERPAFVKSDRPEDRRAAFTRRDGPFNKRAPFTKSDAPPSKRASYSDRSSKNRSNPPDDRPPSNNRAPFIKEDAPPSNRSPYPNRPSFAKSDAPADKRPAFRKGRPFAKDDAKQPDSRPPYPKRAPFKRQDAPTTKRPSFAKSDPLDDRRPAFNKRPDSSPAKPSPYPKHPFVSKGVGAIDPKNRAPQAPPPVSKGPKSQLKTLDRVMSKAGIGSRTEARSWIGTGRVRVNGLLVQTPDFWVNIETDTVTLDENPVDTAERRYVLLNKPKGYITTYKDPEGRPTVYDLLTGIDQFLGTVGRLDLDTSGLLLLTNDNDLAEAVTNPAYQLEKTYMVKAATLLADEQLERLRKGVELNDGPTQPAVVNVLRHVGKHTFLEITIAEGRNRQIRRMLEAVESKVLKLVRVKLGHLTLEDLPIGTWRDLTEAEVIRLSSGKVRPRSKILAPLGKPEESEVSEDPDELPEYLPSGDA